MNSQLHQDEIILSERNEQDLFNSDDNSEDGYSDNQSISDGGLGNPDDNLIENMNYEEQNLLKQNEEQNKEEKKKKKEVKATYLEQVKGYMGFGTLLLGRKIGNVCLVPIPSSWTFKFQVITTQTIIGLFAFVILFTFKYASELSILSYMQYNFSQDYYNLKVNYITKQMNHFNELLNLSVQESNQYKYLGFQQINQSNFLVYHQFEDHDNKLFWPEKQSFRVSDGIPIHYQEISENIDTFYSEFTYSFATYHANYNRQQIIKYTLRFDNTTSQYLNINYLIPTQFNQKSGIVRRIYWNFIKQNFTLVYPGVKIKDLDFFISNISQNFDEFTKIQDNSGQKEIIIPVVHDKLNGDTCSYIVSKIQFGNHKTLGTAYAELSVLKIDALFDLIINGSEEKLTLIMLDKNNITLNDGLMKTGINFNNQTIYNFTQEGFSKILAFQSTNEQPSLKIKSANQTQYQIWAFFNKYLGINFLFLNDDSIMIQNEIENEKSFQLMTENDFLTIQVILPLLMMLISVLLFIRWIKPMEYITEMAYMQLKKNKKIDYGELDEIKGDGLINQLTTLCKTLIDNLNDLKLENKNQLCKYYQLQTYPKNLKTKDLSKVRAQIEVIKQLSESEIYTNLQNDKSQKYFKLIPNQDE